MRLAERHCQGPRHFLPGRRLRLEPLARSATAHVKVLIGAD
jgi:hypothetical protein